MTYRIGALALIAVMLAGCGPRHLTPAEQAAQRAKAAADAARARAEQAHEQRVQAEQQARAAREQAIAKAAEAQRQAAQRDTAYQTAEWPKQPLPDGVTQVTATTFFVADKWARNARYICFGPVIQADNSTTRDDNTVSYGPVRWNSTSFELRCQWPVRKYRDYGFERRVRAGDINVPVGVRR